MPILYSAIAQKNEIFAEYPEREYPKLAEVCTRIVASIPLNETRRKTFEEDTYKFHYKSEGERVYICVAHKETALRVAFAFLESVASQLNRDFNSPKKLLKDRMDFHNNPANDKITNLRNEIDEVKDVMMENIDRVLQRGEKLDALTDKSTRLAETAQDFHKSARTLKRAFCMKHAKIVALIVVIILIIIIVVLLIACNPNFSKCRPS
jgi:vesicle-associated membrane protein 7